MAADNPRISPNGTKLWHQNGKRHREDGPAIERANGDKEWLQNGKLHRTDGPAVELSNGIVYWWIDGQRYSFSEWLTKCSLSQEEKIELVLTYGR